MSYKNSVQSLNTLSGLTTDGRSWLTTTLDPFHDSEVKISGYPDGQLTHGYVIVQRETLDLEAPEEKQWDCHVAIVPDMFYRSAVGVSAAVDGNGLVTYTSGQVLTTTQGNVVIRTNVAGSPTFNETDQKWVGPAGSFALPSQNNGLEEGAARVIGIAFEVHNTSSPLNRGGSVTCYRMPAGVTREMHIATDDSKVVAEAHMMSYLESYQPPGTIATASVIPNSRNWEAKDGAYVVGTLGSDDVVSEAPQSIRRLYVRDGMTDTAAEVSMPLHPTHLWPNAPTNFDIAGAYFTQLPVEATLRVSVIRYLEITPTPSSMTISAATHSASYDPVALDYYFKIKNSLPPGVPVADNGSGDWFRAIGDALEAVAGKSMHIIDQTLLGGIPLASSAYNFGKKTISGMVRKKPIPPPKTPPPPEPRKQQSKPKPRQAQKKNTPFALRKGGYSGGGFVPNNNYGRTRRR